MSGWTGYRARKTVKPGGYLHESGKAGGALWQAARYFDCDGHQVPRWCTSLISKAVSGGDTTVRSNGASGASGASGANRSVRQVIDFLDGKVGYES